MAAQPGGPDLLQQAALADARLTLDQDAAAFPLRHQLPDDLIYLHPCICICVRQRAFMVRPLDFLHFTSSTALLHFYPQ